VIGVSLSGGTANGSSGTTVRLADAAARGWWQAPTAPHREQLRDAVRNGCRRGFAAIEHDQRTLAGHRPGQRADLVAGCHAHRAGQCARQMRGVGQHADVDEAHAVRVARPAIHRFQQRQRGLAMPPMPTTVTRRAVSSWICRRTASIASDHRRQPVGKAAGPRAARVRS
jgi:hypothetical protein